MGHSLCNRCNIRFSCCLNYDGVPCRKNRDVEPTNYDRIMDMSAEELAEFLKEAEYRPPWADAFGKARCDKCKTETVTVMEEPRRTLEVNPCDFTDGECPHGSDITWWLAQRAPTKEGKNREG